MPSEPIRIGDQIEVPNKPGGVTLDSGIVIAVHGGQITFRVTKEYDAMERDWDLSYFDVEPFERTIAIEEISHHRTGRAATSGDSPPNKRTSARQTKGEPVATAAHLDRADDATRALLARREFDGILSAIEYLVDEDEDDWADWLTREYAGENEPWEGTGTVYDWQLVALRQASDHVVGEVHADVAMALEGYPKGYATTVVIDIVLGREDGDWTAELAEPRPHRLLTERFGAAFAYASAHHTDHRRKGTQVPYIAHLLGVTSLLLEMGSGSEDEAIAALLHDVVEDGGGMIAAGEILRQFGPDVLRIVLANSDTTVEPKPEWLERKRSYIAAIAHKAPDELRVSLADKLHNARAILSDYRVHGEALWTRFNADSGEQIRWYYRELATAFRNRRDDFGAGAVTAVEELTRCVSELDALATRATRTE